MAGSTLTTEQLPNAIDRRIKKHFKDTYPTVAPKLETIFKIQTQEDAAEYEEDYQGLGDYEATQELETYKLDNFGEAYQTIYTPTKYTKRVPLTMEAQMWDKSGLTKAGYIGSEMAKAAAKTIEAKAASVLLNGFDTSYTSYGDSKPVFSVGHTRPDGGTAQSNASGSGIVFNEENFETALIAMQAQKNKRGRLINTMPRVLLVPPELEKKALEVTKSIQKSGVSDNDTNVYNMKNYYGGGIRVVVWQYLSVAAGGTGKAWYLLDSEMCQLIWKWAKKPTVKQDNTTGVQSDTNYWLGMYYASYGWSDWVGLWGSAGDGAAYTA